MITTGKVSHVACIYGINYYRIPHILFCKQNWQSPLRLLVYFWQIPVLQSWDSSADYFIQASNPQNREREYETSKCANHRVLSATLGFRYGTSGWRAKRTGFAFCSIAFPICIIKRLDRQLYSSVTGIVIFTALLLELLGTFRQRQPLWRKCSCFNSRCRKWACGLTTQHHFKISQAVISSQTNGSMHKAQRCL